MIDEYGRPILLLQGQETKKRLKGAEASKVNKNKISQTSSQLNQSLPSFVLL
jgi:hypothetical protein